MMRNRPIITLESLRNTACAKLNPHLFEKDKKKSKYGNKKVVIDGITFDSKKEGKRYQQLKMMQTAGLITDLELQVKYELIVNGKIIAKYIADFRYKENGVEIVEDVKSSATRKLPLYRLKKKLMREIYGVTILET